MQWDPLQFGSNKCKRSPAARTGPLQAGRHFACFSGSALPSEELLCFAAKLLRDLGYTKPYIVPFVVTVTLQKQCVGAGIIRRSIFMPTPEDFRVDFYGFVKRNVHERPHLLELTVA